MKTHRVALLAAAFALAAPVSAIARQEAPLPARVVDGQLGDWTGSSTMLGGTTQLSRGELVYQDYIYDDAGANTNARSTQRSTFSEGRIDGDYRYPTTPHRYADNAADILEVRLAADADTVWLLVRLNTLRAIDTTVVGLAVDSVAGAGGGAWPHGAGLTTAGTDAVVTLRNGDGDITFLDGSPTVAVGDVAFDVTTNAIEAAIPRATLGGDTWRIHLATGLWDATAGTWQAIQSTAPNATTPGYGSPTVAARAFNVAFRDDFGPYFERGQAAALADGDIDAFAATVDLPKLVAGVDEPYVFQLGKVYEAIVEESFTVPPLGEGMSFDGVAGRGQGLGGAALEQTFNYFGRHQPYGLYVPKRYAGEPTAAMLVLHGHGGSHAGFNTSANFVEQMGENPSGAPTILVSPLGRGSSMYSDYGEADVLEVLDDAASRVAIDPDRLYIGGYSMGGHGTYRLASLYPDRFAAAVSWAGYTGEFTGKYTTDFDDLTGNPAGLSDVVQPITRPIVDQVLGNTPEERGAAPSGNPVQTLENLRHLPLLHLAGTNDEILPVTGQYAAARRLEQLGYRHRFDLYPGYEHVTFAVVDQWESSRAWLGDLTRVTRPRRITHKVSAAWNDPALPVDLGLEHGRAWWLTELRQHNDVELFYRFATADLESMAIAGLEPVPVIEHGAEPRPTPHVQRGTRWDEGEPLAVANRVVATFTNASHAAFDLVGAGVDLTRPGDVTVTTDGPMTMCLLGKGFAVGAGTTVIPLVDGELVRPPRAPDAPPAPHPRDCR